MAKRVKYAGQSAGIPITPAQTLSESFGSVYPKHIDTDENKQLMLGVENVVPYDPSTGKAVMPSYVVDQSYLPFNLSPTWFASTTGVVTAAGSTAVKTPTTGKKFRLQGVTVMIPSVTTCATTSVITLMDNATVIANLAYVGATTGAVFYQITYPGRGLLSSTINNVLNLNIGTALTAGGVMLNAWGIEE